MHNSGYHVYISLVMMTSSTSTSSTFSALLALCAGNLPVTGEFPSQRPVTRNPDIFFDLRLNKQLNKPPRRWWFETLSRSLLRHCNCAHISLPSADGYKVVTYLPRTDLKVETSPCPKTHRKLDPTKTWIITVPGVDSLHDVTYVMAANSECVEHIYELYRLLHSFLAQP